MASEPYNLDPAFERSVVALACSRTRFYGRIGHAVDADLLHSETAKLALRAVQAVGRELGHGPESSVIVIQRLRRWMHEGRVTLEQINSVIDLLDDADDAGLPSEDSIIAELTPVLQRRMEAEAVRAAMDEYAKRGDFTRIQDLISKASRLGVCDTSIGTVLGADSFAEISKLHHLDRLETGIPELDMQLDGGMPRGAEGVVVGGAGDGKSMYLSHQAAHGMRLGLHTLYASLELPPSVVLSRIKANLTGVPVNSILEGDSAEAIRRLEQLNMTLGRCVVKEFTAHATTIEDIREWVKLCEDQAGRPVDLLIVDYADKLTASVKDKSEYQIMRVVYEGLRIYAVEKNFWCWTASQASRAGKDSKRLDLQHVADSMHKVRVADLVITLNVRGDEGEEILFYIAKNRTGKARTDVGPLPTDFSHGRIAPVLVP